ncbi:Gldg family protein [Pseudomonas sp. lyk4-TYG-107]|jgi:ABC-type uncharacterized transport system involved in gliding motility auxiliary subunit|uniref:GldG family protein n=1 Tax=Pseudomonas sp. lyk4-TYG-107 TaxID=3040317 RepID=UPI00255524CD|nr:Gldg family protein [Pseudomonas sp. lyk4-TYG-107]
MVFNRFVSTCLWLALIAGLFGLINLDIAPRLSDMRLDLTERSLYTLSAGSRQIIQDLKEPVDLYLYFSSQAAKDIVVLRSYAARVEALLQEYQRVSDERLRLHVIDPVAFSEQEVKATELGLEPLDFGAGTAPVFFGLAMVDGQNHHASIPMFVLNQQSFLEYDVSRLLQSLARPQRPSIGLISTLPLMGGFNSQTRKRQAPWLIAQEIRKVFEVQELAPQTEQIPEDLKVLMLVHPKHLAQSTLRAVDQFVLRGGRLLVFVDPYSEWDRGDQYFGIPSKDKSSDLTPLLKAWGVRLLPGRILGDGEFGQFVLLQQGGAEPVWQPTALKLTSGAINPEDVITAGLGSITLSTSGILNAVQEAKTTLTPLLHSSQQTMLVETSILDHLKDPAELARSFVPSAEAHMIAVRIQGAAESAFVHQPDDKALTHSDQINVVVVADTDLLSNNLWADVESQGEHLAVEPWADNAAFVLNALDSLSGSDALISLRSRGHYSRTFTVIEQLKQQAQTRFRQMNSNLQQALDSTERQLTLLAEGRDPNLPLTAEQKQAVDRFTAEKTSLEQQMREVALQLNTQVERLGKVLRLINIVLVPLLISFLFLSFVLWRWHVRTRKKT